MINQGEMHDMRMKDGDFKFMSTNGALDSHSIWNDSIKQRDSKKDSGFLAG